MKNKINEVLSEIKELNGLDNKTLPERIVKFNEEFGEYNAEVCKLIGISHKPYDKPHLIEESADFLQNAFSVLIETGELAGFTLDDVFAEIQVKNKKWREKAPQYTKNVNNNIPEVNLLLETKEVKCASITLTVRNCSYHGFVGKTVTILNWFFKNKGLSFKEYLDSPAKYVYDIETHCDINGYHDLESDKKLTELLKKELDSDNIVR